MKHVILAICISCLASCAGGINILGTNVEIVNNRAPDGTYLPVNQVRNAAGEVADSSASVYHFPSGGLGVSAYVGALNGQFPKLLKK